jgi:ATP-dependent RNA helicase SUPV3L1/SUV3
LLDRRISIEKLSKHLRISKGAALDFMSKAGLVQSANSQGYVGWVASEVKFFLANLPEDAFSILQEYRKQLEEYKERARDELLLKNPSNFFNLDRVSKVLEIPLESTEAFLRKNNVLYFQSLEKLYLREDILEIKNKPSRFQALDLRRLRTVKNSSKHINNARLAKLFDVPVEIVTPLKKKLQLTGFNPLTESMVTEALNRSDFESKKIQVLKSDRIRRPSPRKVNDRERFVSRYDLAALLGLSHEEISLAIKSHLLPTDHHNRFVREEVSYVDTAKLRASLVRAGLKVADEEEDVRNIFESQTSRAAQKIEPSFDERILGLVSVVLPRRESVPLQTTLYLGPTNSGKTYNALQTLFSEYDANPDGKYVYAGPLRMLAFEVYEKMVEKYGDEVVGFITGEEQINPNAPLIAATAEMAPHSGTALVLDEAHWFIEESRGHHWTNLLAGGNYQTFHVLAAAEAKDTILELLKDSVLLDVREFTRKTKLSYAGDIHYSKLPPKTAVVAFSRKGVYAIAQAIEGAGIKVGVLYGALPLAARKNQIEKFIKGEYSVIVTTDVIGHGINLPVDNVVFAETNKYDGVENRELRLWEAAQIAGRAGRYGLSEEGKVYALTGIEWAEASQSIVSDAAKAAMGTISTGMIAEKAIIAPSFSDFSTIKPSEISHAMECWQQKAEDAIGEERFAPSTLKDITDCLKVVAGTLNLSLHGGNQPPAAGVPSNLSLITGERVMIHPATSWRMSATDLWQIINGPFDVKLETLKALAGWLQENKMTNAIERLFSIHVEGVENFYETLEQLETAARLVSELKMVNFMFPDETYVLDEELDFCEQNISEEIISILNRGLNDNVIGLCQSCGKNCNPWFDLCSGCFEEKGKIRA